MPNEILTKNRREDAGRGSKASKGQQPGKGEELEKCYVPECNLGEKDVKKFMPEFRKYMQLFKNAFRRKEQRQHSQTYVEGLLGNAQRKNVEQMALTMGENVRSLQYFVGQSPWEVEPVIEVHQGLIGKAWARKME